MHYLPFACSLLLLGGVPLLLGGVNQTCRRGWIGYDTGIKGISMSKKLVLSLWLASVFSLAATAQEANDKEVSALYFHPYKPAINGSFQLQPKQGFSIIEPYAGFVRMVQVCVRDTKSVGAMPVPTPMLATRTGVGGIKTAGTISVGSCAVLEGESIAVGIYDGTVDTDTSDANSRRQLSYMSGTYTVLGYYSSVPPQAPIIEAAKK